MKVKAVVSVSAHQLIQLEIASLVLPVFITPIFQTQLEPVVERIKAASVLRYFPPFVELMV